MPNRQLVLASTSPYRRVLMDRLRIPYETTTPPFDEVVDLHTDARAQIEAFAHGKAASVAAAFPDALIIGSDQGLIAFGELLGKPGTVEKAEAQLARLAGGTYDLVTAVCLLDARSGQCEHAIDVHRLVFRSLGAEEIAAYVAIDQPVDCAGSFKIESLGVTLFEAVEGNDPTAIEGLPLITLVGLLHRAGFDVLRAARR